MADCKVDKEKFQIIHNEILIEIILKNTNRTERVNIDTLDDIYDEIKDREIKEFKVLHIKDFGKSFASCRKFVETLEGMLVDYYSSIVQFLFNWTPPAPKIIEEQKANKKEPVKIESKNNKTENK